MTTPPLSPRSEEAVLANALPGRRTKQIVVMLALAVLFLVVMPLALLGQPYWLSVATNACMLSFGSLGVWVMFSIGRIDIAQGAFATLGGYTTAILSTRYGLSFWLCLPLSALIPSAIGTLIGIPILRLRGIYFAMITLSLAEAVRLAALNGGSLTGGANGVISIPQPPGIDTPLAFYLLSAVLLLLALFAVWRLTASPIGLIFRSMRLNQDLASSAGIDVAYYRVIAFSFACGIGGICGAFFAAFHQNIFPSTYTVIDSINFMLYCFLGGLDYVLGPVIGSFLLVVSFELLDAVQQFQALLYGVLMIAVMLFLPNGLLSLSLSSWKRPR